MTHTITEPEHLEWELAERTDEWFDWREVVVYDCEANGLLDLPDYHLHCGWLYDMRDRRYHGFRPDQLGEMYDLLNGRVVVAHNGLGYDYQALAMEAHKYGKQWAPKLEVDTLVMVRMMWPIDDLIEPDARLWRRGLMPGNKMKTQGIEAWGYRLGEMKGDYSHEMHERGLDPWANFNEEMFSYNQQDVRVNLKLLLRCFKKMGWFQPADWQGHKVSASSVELEHKMQNICLDMEKRGAGFNQQKALTLAGELAELRAEREAVVVAAFKPWWQVKGDIVKGTIAPAKRRYRRTDLPKVVQPRWSEKTGKRLADAFDHPWVTIEQGAAFVPVEWTSFKLSNRHHLAARLQAVYGWKPTAFGGKDGTDPVVDEATIKAIPDKVLKPELKQAILDWYVIDKTYNTLVKGKNSWLNLYDPETHTIHGRVNPLGTITHRAAHDKPNLGNIPSVELDEEKDASGKVVAKTAVIGVAGGFGEECRECFGPPPPFDTQTGTDMYALEIFMLANRLAKYDGGRLAQKLEDPDYDIHQDNANICGLARKDVKATFYKTLYGSGALDVGRDVWKDDDDDAEWYDAPGVKRWISWHQEHDGDLFKMPTKHDKALYGKGRLYQKKLIDAIDGLGEFKKNVTNFAKTHGYLIALDGRRISVRKEFAALNALLQCDGAIASKVWIVETLADLDRQHLKPARVDQRGRYIEIGDYALQTWTHDETQWAHLKDLGSLIGETAERAVKTASLKLGLKAILRTDFKIGQSWAECH